MLILWLVGSWLIGLLAGARSTQPPGAWLIITACALIVTVLMGRAARWRQIGLIAILFTLGAAWQAAHQNSYSPSDLAYYNDQGTFSFSGVIAAPPEISGKDLQLRVAVDSIHLNGTDQPISGLALVQADPLTIYHYGDRLTLHGDPLTPPDNGSFDYRDYIAIDGVYTVFVRPTGINVKATDQGSPFWAAMYSFRERALSLIDSWLPSPPSALLAGIVLGVRTELPNDVRDQFSATGASRILAIDGAKVAIVIGLLNALFSPLAIALRRRSLAALLIVITLAAYTLFVGAQPPVLRAATMGILAILAERLGRDNNGLSGLAIAIWLQTLINPAVVHDSALWISATATLGLVLAAGPVQRRVDQILDRLFTRRGVQWLSGFIVESVLVTAIVYIATLPVMLLVFGTFSPLGVLINIVISPAQALILAVGLPAVTLGAIIPPIGQLLAWIAALPLSYTLALVRGGADLQGVPLPVTIAPAAVVAYYAVGLALWNVLQSGTSLGFGKSGESDKTGRVMVWLRTKLASPPLIIGGLAIAALLWVIALARPDGRLHVWILDVSGGGILLQTPGGGHILIDGGDTPSQLNAALGDHLPFGTSTLDAVFITTPKPGLSAALPNVLSRYPTRAIFTGLPLSGGSTLRAAEAAFGSTNTPVITVTTGYQLTLNDGTTITILSPANLPVSGTSGGSLNTTQVDNAALVLKVTYKNASFLIAPEMTAATENSLIADHTALGADVLLLPAHGSDAANSPAFLKVVAPQIAALQIDSGKLAAQPSPATLARLNGTPIYRTDSQGTIGFATDGESLWITPER